MHMKMHYAISKTIYTIYQIYQYETFSNLHSQHMSFNSDQPSPKFAHLRNLQYHLQWPTHTIYFINYETNTPNSPTQSQTFQMGSKNSPKIPTIRSQVLGHIKRSFKVSNQPKHYKTLKQSVTSSRIKPLPHGVC